MLQQSFKTSNELGIEPWIYTGLIEVLRMLESEELIHKTFPHREPGEWFNMSHWESISTCGTARCIGGWVEHIMGRKLPDYGNDIPSKLDNLFYPPSIEYYKHITTKQAAHALRTYLETGIPDWGKNE